MNLKGLKAKAAEKQHSLRMIIPIVLISVVALIIIVGAIINYNGRADNLKISITSLLESYEEISDVTLTKYHYNAIARTYKEDSDKVKIYVAYEGTVYAGIDFSEVKINFDDQRKVVLIEIPEPKIISTVVDTDSLDFIYTKEKYKNEKALHEVINSCKSDLAERASKDDFLKKVAAENAKNSFKALFEPIIESIDDDYTIEFIGEGEY